MKDRNVDLIETHTGVIKDRNKWYTKLSGKGMECIPFAKWSLQFFGDGKIFVYNVQKVVKVRTGEEDYEALKDHPLIDKTTIGLKGSPTNIFKSFTPPQKGAGMMLEGADKATCEKLADILAKKHII